MFYDTNYNLREMAVIWSVTRIIVTCCGASGYLLVVGF
jgi:hypothetical protein